MGWVYHSLSKIGLYGNTNKLRLPFSSVREEFIVARAREHLQYSRSRDTKVSGAGIVVRTGRTAEAGSKQRLGWSISPSLEQWRKAERTWEHKSDPIWLCQWKGEAETGAGGGASFSRGRANQQKPWPCGSKVPGWVGAGDGAKCHLDGHLEVEPPEDQVLDSGVYDVLPSPSNLCTCGKLETPACPFVTK